MLTVMDDMQLQNEEGGQAPSSYYDQLNPRISLWTDTVGLLKASGVSDSNGEVVEFCNNAVQLTIRRGHGRLPDLNDVMALGVALESRDKELNVIMLDLVIVINDLVFLSEYGAVMGTFKQEVKRELAR